jgi:ABC-type multidrug transport system fused ATPase/permease subunit
MLCIIPPVALITVFFGRKIRKYSREVQDRVAESNVIVGESMQGIANVKSFTNESFEIARYTKSTGNILINAMRYARARGGFFSFIIFCLFGSIMVLVWAGVQMTIGHNLYAGDLMKFLLYTLFVAASIGGIPEQYAQIQRAVGASERIFEILDETPEPIDTNPERERRRLKLSGKLELKNLSFTYPTRKEFQVLKNISLSANAGETIAIVGPSGSGKSTIAQLLLRFYDPENGNLFFDGKDAREYDLTDLRENMAIVPQDVLLFGGSIRENIAYGKPGSTDEEIVEASKKANAYSFIESFPDKFDTLVGDRGIQLSGGQRQRIAIARAVLKNPAILILDEATSSLDSESERIVQEALDKLMIGRTSIVIAHRLATIRNADKIIVVENGKVVEAGTHEELIAMDNGLYRSLSRLQFQGEMA